MMTKSEIITILKIGFFFIFLSSLVLSSSAITSVNFSANTVSGIAPLTVTFTDTSEGNISAWNWSFGDGSFSEEQNCSHVFESGVYTIILNVWDGELNETDSYSIVITVLEPDPKQIETKSMESIESTNVISLISVLTPSSSQFFPRIFRDYIVWFDDSGSMNRIHVYNITDGSDLVIPMEISADSSVLPNIHQDIVVWQGYDGPNASIYAYDIIKGENFPIVSDQFSSPSFPDIFGDYVVWSEWRYVSSDIFIKNLKTGEEVLLTPDTPGIDDSVPSIHGNLVVWQGTNHDDYTSDIYLLNVSSGETVIITPFTPGSSETFPCIYGDFISYQSMGTDFMTDIMLYNIDTGETIVLTPNTPSTNEDSAYVYGDKVVWNGQDPLNGTTDIYLHNITTGETHLLTPNSEGTSRYLPSIFENRVVWQQEDQERGYFDIHMATLGVEKPPLMADFGLNSTSGGIPLPVKFFDQSSGEVSNWMWDFGDGNISSEKDAEHTYREPGSYTVTLIISNPYQRSGVLKENVLNAGSPPVVSFLSNVTEGPAPLSVSFSDTSLWEPDSWTWVFGDGSVSGDQNPEHIFIEPGSYNITLTVTNSYGEGKNNENFVIEVTNGTRKTLLLNIGGIDVTEGDSGQAVIINSSNFQSFSIEPGSLEIYPGNESGVQKLVFMTDDAVGFQWKDQYALFGNISGISLTSQDLILKDDSHYFSFQFEDYLSEYPVNGVFSCELWEGTTEQDYRRFNEIAVEGNMSSPDWDSNVYSGVSSVAFTGRVISENIPNPGPATIIIGLDSDWISEYGWAYGYEVTSDPPGIRGYLDGQLVGYTPFYIPGTIPSGNHTLVLRDSQYGEQIREIVIDKIPSIRVIRIGDDGIGDTLETEFLYHDDERNMDIFRAYSPKGLSTFGVVSTSKSGNVFQMLYLSLSRVLSPIGGSGGTRTSSGLAGAGSTPTPITTTAPDLVPSPITTVTPIGNGPGPTVSPQGTPPGDEEKPVPPESPQDNGNPYTTPPGTLPSVPATMVMLKNLSVVFVVILVTVVFYLRWKRRGD